MLLLITVISLSLHLFYVVFESLHKCIGVYYSYFTSSTFFTQTFAGSFFSRNFRDSKSAQITRTLPSILADLNNAIVYMIFICPFISKSSRPLNNYSYYFAP